MQQFRLRRKIDNHSQREHALRPDQAHVTLVIVSRIFRTFDWRRSDLGSCRAGLGKVGIPQQIHLQVTLGSPLSTGNMP